MGYVSIISLSARHVTYCSELNGSPCPQEHSSHLAYNCFSD
jgi:hypothetical protein